MSENQFFFLQKLNSGLKTQLAQVCRTLNVGQNTIIDINLPCPEKKAFLIIKLFSEL